jgi:hypothetical protein
MPTLEQKCRMSAIRTKDLLHVTNLAIADA